MSDTPNPPQQKRPTRLGCRVLIVFALVGCLLGMTGAVLELQSYPMYMGPLWAIPLMMLWWGFIGAVVSTAVGCLAAAWLEKWVGKQA